MFEFNTLVLMFKMKNDTLRKYLPVNFSYNNLIHGKILRNRDDFVYRRALQFCKE